MFSPHQLSLLIQPAQANEVCVSPIYTHAEMWAGMTSKSHHPVANYCSRRLSCQDGLVRRVSEAGGGNVHEEPTELGTFGHCRGSCSDSRWFLDDVNAACV